MLTSTAQAQCLESDGCERTQADSFDCAIVLVDPGDAPVISQLSALGATSSAITRAVDKLADMQISAINIEDRINTTNEKETTVLFPHGEDPP